MLSVSDAFYLKKRIELGDIATAIGEGMSASPMREIVSKLRRFPVRTPCGKTIGVNYAWCSDWKAYEESVHRPVFYAEAHHDIVYPKEPLRPVFLDDELVLSTYHDNRLCCGLLCDFVREVHSIGVPSTRDKEPIVCCIWTDGEETGFTGIHSWFQNDRVPHSQEFFVVLDVTKSEVRQQQGAICSSLGFGPYRFLGDPAAEILQKAHSTASGASKSQACSFREPYPGNLVHTNAGAIYHNYVPVAAEQGCRLTVCRMAVPVYIVPKHKGDEGDDGCKQGSLHSRLAIASRRDAWQMLQDLLLVYKSLSGHVDQGSRM